MILRTSTMMNLTMSHLTLLEVIMVMMMKRRQEKKRTRRKETKRTRRRETKRMRRCQTRRAKSKKLAKTKVKTTITRRGGGSFFCNRPRHHVLCGRISTCQQHLRHAWTGSALAQGGAQAGSRQADCNPGPVRTTGARRPRCARSRAHWLGQDLRVRAAAAPAAAAAP